jgi:energy-coupling factor transporter ATP-binding protein EcfA2
MSSTVRVQAARIPDRNRLLEALRAVGLDAEPEDEVGIVVPVGEGGSELFHQVEGVVFSVGAPFVPIEHEGVIYIRPPVG